ncbi:fused chemotaxis regulator; protein-glutamate methylesterase in two-component regulatory system with CheA [Enterobacter cancerogenus]|uniref:protein-glutamate methylesterase/protein-glutamine glutaminase n=1 Tax=Enterobacter cancerogenus TaxID=69218 RepID=UPI0019291491|nr:chemotaxis response regulator protein-glutamate methylesterase [Enterobacter cancerogenus]CAD5358425.1 fused chemotaxis regulator; protein-glutamate methylesterase in two-component regulatory system with CheA [Enterobacter cancerogenus]
MQKIKVLCVDDSALIRNILTDIVNQQPDMEMVATAPDPLIARDLIKRLNPDVLTLDVEMPRMDGLDFLARLMRLRPMPVIMVSSLTSKGSEITLSALEIGAVDFVTKPQLRLKEGMHQYSELIAEKIRMAAHARVFRRDNPPPPALMSAPLLGSEKIFAVGSSTGGTEALRQLLLPLPRNCPALLIAQHMPPGFTRSFAERLDRQCHLRVKEAENGERVLPGHAYIAPGALHLELARSGANYIARLSDSPPCNRHRPSVDVLFQSVAKAAGKNATGVILTGMGNDGAQGLIAMRNAGAHTLAQSEKTCAVFGMPREAIALNAAVEVVDLDEMSQRMLQSVAGQTRRI